MSYIGVDYGTRRVGVAVSDEGGVVAFPQEVVPEKEALAHIRALAKEREARTIVIGESKDFSGKDNPVMKRITAFAEALRKDTGAEIVFEPEFMTSAQASRAEDANGTLDASAAALILQSFLDRRKSDRM